MTGGISTERVFSLSSFEGLKLLRKYSAEQSNLGQEELIGFVLHVDPDASSLDLEAAIYLHTFVDGECSLENPEFYQVCIKAVVVTHQPLWSKAMRQGRKRFVATLDENDQDVFAAAGLLMDPPSLQVVMWWDDVAGHARLITDIEKMAQARVAERLSYDHELEKIAASGIDREVVWTGLDDNYAGYDILSYELVDGDVANRMIEVKSTIASPLRFIITRNEWEQAAKIGEAYSFHVWDMAKNPPELHIRSVAQIEGHIPSDQQDGKWSSAAIPLSVA